MKDTKSCYILKMTLYEHLDFLHRLTPTYRETALTNSTFKTNQEKFELFAVLINCGEYGIPLAYLYVDTFTALADCFQDPRNRINSRVKVLKEFCLALRTECILPTFILIDKDAGQIAAINEAWSQIANIQLCLWHIERAIDRK